MGIWILLYMWFELVVIIVGLCGVGFGFGLWCLVYCFDLFAC